LSRMSDLDLALREGDAPYEEEYSFYEMGSHAFISGARNPFMEGSFAYEEFERGYMSTAKRESRGDDV